MSNFWQLSPSKYTWNYYIYLKSQNISFCINERMLILLFIGADTINPLSTNVPLLYPLKASENARGFLLFSGSIRVKNCRANQWTGFYMITASVMKGLNKGTIHGYTKIETVSDFKYKLRLTQDDETMYSFPQRHFTNKGHQQICSEGYYYWTSIIETSKGSCRDLLIILIFYGFMTIYGGFNVNLFA